MLKARRMTREEFQDFVVGERGWPRPGGANAPIQILVQPPYEVVPCDCGDVNCHGWRFVERRQDQRADFAVVPVDAIA